MSSGEDVISFEGEIEHETEKAWLLVIDGEKHWLPKSQCELVDGGTILVPEWLAMQKGMI